MLGELITVQLTRREIMCLPIEVRRRIMAEQAKALLILVAWTVAGKCTGILFVLSFVSTTK